MLPDYYAILEVPATATAAELKRAYRRLVRKYHPDLNQSALDTHIKRLNRAYEVLSDPEKRAAYDARRVEEQRRCAAQEGLRRPQAPEMSWPEGMIGFVRELKKEQVGNSSEMSWPEGIIGFVKELRKGLKEE